MTCDIVHLVILYCEKKMFNPPACDALSIYQLQDWHKPRLSLPLQVGVFQPQKIPCFPGILGKFFATTCLENLLFVICGKLMKPLEDQ